MKLVKKIIGIALLLTLTLSAFTLFASSAPQVTVTLDGELIVFDGQGPIITGNRTLVPVRGVFEALGFYPTFDDATRQATLTRDDFVVIITIDSEYFTTNGETFTLDVPARIVMGRTLLPLRAVLESVGYDNMDFDPITRVVSIYTTPLSQSSPTPSPTPSPPSSMSREDIGISITLLEYEDDPLLAELDFMHIASHGSNIGDTLLIRALVPISEVKIVYIEPGFTDPDTAYFVSSDTINVAENVLPSEGIIIKDYMGLGSFPWSAISFLDENGDKWYFAISQNNADQLIYPYLLIHLVRCQVNEDRLLYAVTF